MNELLLFSAGLGKLAGKLVNESQRSGCITAAGQLKKNGTTFYDHR